MPATNPEAAGHQGTRESCRRLPRRCLVPARQRPKVALAQGTGSPRRGRGGWGHRRVGRLTDRSLVRDQTTGAISATTLEAVRRLLADPDSALDPVPVGIEVAAAYETIPLKALRDPWDRFIMATAKALDAPLVTADSKIAASGLVEVLW